MKNNDHIYLLGIIFTQKIFILGRGNSFGAHSRFRRFNVVQIDWRINIPSSSFFPPCSETHRLFFSWGMEFPQLKIFYVVNQDFLRLKKKSMKRCCVTQQLINTGPTLKHKQNNRIINELTDIYRENQSENQRKHWASTPCRATHTSTGSTSSCRSCGTPQGYPSQSPDRSTAWWGRTWAEGASCSLWLSGKET